MRISVCRDCERRREGCHGSCEEYQKERKALDEYNAEIKRKKWKIAEADNRMWSGQKKMMTTPKPRKGRRYKGEQG